MFFLPVCNLSVDLRVMNLVVTLKKNGFQYSFIRSFISIVCGDGVSEAQHDRLCVQSGKNSYMTACSGQSSQLYEPIEVLINCS